MTSNVFTKRSGTSDRGHEFEHYFIANLLLKLITDDDVEDFFLSSDDKDYGSFDDVVVEIVYRSEHRQIYAIQLKHLEQKNLTVAALESDKGKFAINNYFENFNFQNDYTAVILYTNASLRATNGQVLNLGNFEKTNIWKTSLESVFTTSENGEFYYLGNENSTDFRNFCKHFSLYTNQANGTQLEQQTRGLFEKLFECQGSAFTEYVNFVIKWCKIKGKKEKLTKEWIRNVIAICILKPFVQPLSFSSRVVNENTKILREAISLFQITVFNSGYYEKVRELWSDFKEELTDVKRINRKYSVTSDFIQSVADLDGRDKETSIMLWLLDKCPLILAEAPEVYRAIEVFQEKKFIIFNREMFLQSRSVFRKLSDLENCARIYENILNKFTCSLQGKEEVTLKNFFHGCQDVEEILTIDELLKMLDGPLLIGGRMEVLPACHVPRSISKNVVDTKSLELLEYDALIIIDKFPYTTHLEREEEFYVTTIKDLLNIDSNKENGVYLCERQSSRADVEDLCRKTNKINYYHFSYLSETFLEYISSSKINERQYSIEKQIVKECELYQNDNDINIICANPGMGKTTLMKSLKNNIPSSLWTVLIYARNYGYYFRQKNTNINEFLDHCLIETEKNISIFDQNVIRLLVSQRRIVILWDGLDEMAEENLEIVKKLIHDANVQGYKQWVTSRNHLKSSLEDEFNTLSRSLEKFDRKEQKIYIGARLNLDRQKVDDIFKKIQKNIALFPNNNILGIPLQSFMLTELFLQDKEKYLNLLNEIFSLADLYEHFVDEKFNIYYKEKHNLFEINEILHERNEQDKKLMVNSYEVAAIHTYFDKKIASKLQIDSQKESKKDPIGFIINTTNDGLSEFCHNSFGEYFAALYLTKNHSDFFVTFDLLFEPKYDNIRLFYDLILARGCKGHMFVLYRNYELLTTCTHDEICKTDKLGRSTLEVACTWRKKYPLLQVTDKFRKFKFPQVKVNEITDSHKILSFLVTHLTPNENKYDLILNENNILLPFVSLEKSDIDYLKMTRNHMISILFYAVALDFDTILDFSNDIIPFINWQNVNILTVTLQYRSFNCLKKIIVQEHYKIYISKNTDVLYNILSIFQSNSLFDNMVDLMTDINININTLDSKKRTVLHHACEDNNYEVASWLLKCAVGAFGKTESYINKQDCGGKTPLHFACSPRKKKCSLELVEYLMQNGSDPNLTDNNKKTPLHYACASKEESFYEICSLLIKKGALVNIPDAHGKLPLHYACSKGQFPIVNLLIHHRSYINFLDRSNMTPLQYAYKRNLRSVLNLLFENGAKIDEPDGEGKLLLHYACIFGRLEDVKLYLEKGVDVNVLDKTRRSPLHYACENNRSDIVNLLTANGANSTNKDVKGKTPLFYANLENLRFLIENTAADVNVVDNDGLTLLHHSASNCDFQCVKLLIENGAKIDIADKAGRLPLHFASSRGLHFEEMVELLTDENCTLDALDDENKTLAHYACQFGKDDVVQFLLNAGANFKAADKNGRLPIHFACNNKSYDCHRIVETFIRKSVAFEIPDHNGQFPVHYACRNNRFGHDIIKVLTQFGASINVGDHDGKLPLHHACISGSKSNVILLIELGASVNAPDKYERTPLHYSSAYGHVEITEVLIENGSSVNFSDKDKKLPIHYACLRAHWEISKFSNNGFSFEEISSYNSCCGCRTEAKRLEMGMAYKYEKMRKKDFHRCEKKFYKTVELLLANKSRVDVVDNKGKRPSDYARQYFDNVRINLIDKKI